MAFTPLDEQIILAGLLRQAGGNVGKLAELAVKFADLTAQQRENQIRAEALLEYNETLADITNLEAKIVLLQAHSVVLFNRSEGNQ